MKKILKFIKRPKFIFGIKTNINLAEPNNELFDIFDKNTYQKIGVEKREIVHLNGLLHKSVNVFLINSKFDILLQKRHVNKKIFPLKLDLSCAEHLTPNETYVDAAVRGLNEELGIQVDKNSLIQISNQHEIITKDPLKNIYDHELSQLYICRGDYNIQFNKDEIEDCFYYNFKKIINLIENDPNLFTTWFIKEFKILTTYLDEINSK